MSTNPRSKGKNVFGTGRPLKGIEKCKTNKKQQKNQERSTKIPGYETSNPGYQMTSPCERNDQTLGTKRPNRWVRNDQIRYGMSWIRKVQGTDWPQPFESLCCSLPRILEISKRAVPDRIAVCLKHLFGTFFSIILRDSGIRSYGGDKTYNSDEIRFGICWLSK